jgi:hypothetical protein
LLHPLAGWAFLGFSIWHHLISKSNTKWRALIQPFLRIGFSCESYGESKFILLIFFPLCPASFYSPNKNTIQSVVNWLSLRLISKTFQNYFRSNIFLSHSSLHSNTSSIYILWSTEWTYLVGWSANTSLIWKEQVTKWRSRR